MPGMSTFALVFSLLCRTADSDADLEALKESLSNSLAQEDVLLWLVRDNLEKLNGNTCGVSGYIKTSILGLAGSFEKVYTDMSARELSEKCDGASSPALDTVPTDSLGLFIILLTLAIGSLYLYDHRWTRSMNKQARDVNIRDQEKRYTDLVMRNFNPKLQLEEYRFKGIRDKRQLGRSVSLEFEQLSLRVKDGRNYKTVLEGVTGEFDEGKMCAIMGPSGAGKTSFMNTLCGKAGYGRREGRLEIRVGGRQGQTYDDMASIKTIMGFVPQDDVVHETLTVSEQIRFSAQLRGAPGTPRRVCDNITEDVLHVLQIRHIRNTVVGGQEERGISGGQRKRVNIGLELAADPSLLFLDEPTSGLDSTSSFAVIKSLQKMSKFGLTSIMVIHQPRYSLFELFDDVLLLGVGGKTVYRGPANKIKPYFQDLGFTMPHEENPADWLMDVVSDAASDPPMLSSELPSRWESMDPKAMDDLQRRTEVVGSTSEASNLKRGLADLDLKRFCQLMEEAWDKTDSSKDGLLEEAEVSAVLSSLETVGEGLAHELFEQMSQQTCQGVTYYVPISHVNGDNILVREAEEAARRPSSFTPNRFRVVYAGGVAYRRIKKFEDPDKVTGPGYDEVICGFDEGDGWVKTQAVASADDDKVASWSPTSWFGGTPADARVNPRVSRQAFVRYFRDKAKDEDDAVDGEGARAARSTWTIASAVAKDGPSCLAGLCPCGDSKAEPLLGDWEEKKSKWDCLNGCGLPGCCKGSSVARQHRGCLGQFKILLHRQFVQWVRGRTMRLIFLAVCAIAAVVLAATDLFVSKQPAWSPELYLNLHTALALLSSVYCLSVFNSDRTIFWRECSTGLNVYAFYWARVLANAVDMAMMAFAVGGLYYVIIQPQVEFIVFFWPMILVSFASSGVGFFLGALFPPQHGPFVAAVVSFVSCGLLGHPLKIRQFMALGSAPEMLIDLTSITRWSVGMSFAKAVDELKPMPTSLRELTELNTFKDIYLNEPRYQESGVWHTGFQFLVLQGILYRLLTYPVLKFRNSDKKV